MTLHNVQNAVQTIKCTHVINWTITLIREKIMKVSGINRGPTGSSRGIFCQAKGDHLDQVHSDQKVLDVIRWGRLVLVIGGQESQTCSRDHQAWVHSDQMVLVMARWEAGPRKRTSNLKATLSQDQDQDGQRGHIIGPSWVLHLPAGYSCTEQSLQNIKEFNIISLWLRQTKKSNFFFRWFFF